MNRTEFKCQRCANMPSASGCIYCGGGGIIVREVWETSERASHMAKVGSDYAVASTKRLGRYTTYGPEGLKRQENAHAPFKVGMRVKLNSSFPYKGRQDKFATVTRLPWQMQASHVHIKFDGSEHEVEYAKGYLDIIDR